MFFFLVPKQILKKFNLKVKFNETNPASFVKLPKARSWIDITSVSMLFTFHKSSNIFFENEIKVKEIFLSRLQLFFLLLRY